MAGAAIGTNNSRGRTLPAATTFRLTAAYGERRSRSTAVGDVAQRTVPEIEFVVENDCYCADRIGSAWMRTMPGGASGRAGVASGMPVWTAESRWRSRM